MELSFSDFYCFLNKKKRENHVFKLEDGRAFLFFKSNKFEAP